MRYRVGLDVGTASLGLAAVSLDESNNPIDLIWKHVRIFDEPLEKSQAGLKSKRRVAALHVCSVVRLIVAWVEPSASLH